MELKINHLQHYLAYGLKVQYKGIINGAELKQWEKKFSDRYEINGAYPTIPCPEAIIGDKVGFIKKIEFRKNGSPSFFIGNKVGKRYYDLDGIKPLLLPLSALYEEIDGEIGIICLAKLAAAKSLTDKGEWILGNEYDVHGNAFRVVRNQFLLALFYYHESTQSFHFLTNNVKLVIPQLALFDYLFSHHFDVWNLIGQNLAIDINTVKQ